MIQLFPTYPIMGYKMLVLLSYRTAKSVSPVMFDYQPVLSIQ